MTDIGKHGSMGDAIGGSSIASLLHQDVENHAVLVHRAPQIVQHAADADERLIQVSHIPGPWTTSA
jgi:hypothetical protein